ncbi:MAG: energy-coupling factor transporter transmembrane component T [Lachnospiraceae bacterium]|jgi:energy-coupling factor transport system permease protein|nr:energy-coupling factor transporter transmembrane protein EcfT [Lachnospiraceae bacterium]MDD7702499.1 energy-coupling factor transporter transmembrane component T [Lachnospiraceae bacterium]MDY3302601.1 energy-coupling factor transporter transmembrane component T [Lachnospiraceae bacterium]MEE3433559.1 energy-coupling factor transporter transmembrane component T [Lachnospiraceae bacterium]
MSKQVLSYAEKDTPIHKLSGVTKLVFFLIWCLTSALTYDTRVLLIMIAVSFILFFISKTEWKQVGSIFKFILLMMVINVVAIFLLSPYQGCEIYGTRTVLAAGFRGHEITAEELFYLLNVVIKYFTVTPSIFIFLVTTNPSEFAASLNLVGIPYMVSYSIAIALRYIPDVQDDYTRIHNAQQARGIEMSGKAKLMDRIKHTSAIIFPLLFSTMERIDVVSNAMELRGFGKNKKRSWYSAKKLKAADYISMAASAVFAIAALVFTFYDGSRFYNPFV